ncbi:MAG: hypothetical protein UU71_C0007G0001 [Parcubacteria group bacterium GW2011_GWB1_41_6]|nr:MAG: hypothetical protein UU71_C0007G0001 [Parcubacteria group bacterium GW2011_GWB1_41_6]KKS34270.1 MAG: hypothetical protein UU96_C0006G0008 [Parcubacteria group bacterium GW2011_GWC2_42_13]
MDEEIKKILLRNLEVSEQSLKILKKMRGAQVAARVFKVIYWLMILGIIVGGYIYLKPYLAKLQAMIQNVQNLQQNLLF